MVAMVALQSVKTAQVNGTQLAYLEAGSGPLVLCLHGFPDTAWTWEPLLPRLAAAGYHAVAPFLRGYAPSAIPADRDYSVAAVGADMVALMAHLGAKDAVVIGTDWGALIANYLANWKPELVTRLITMGVPHAVSIVYTWEVVRRSWHLFLLPIPMLAAWWLRRRNFAAVETLVRAWAPSWVYSADDLAPIKRALAAPGGVNAVVQYYRGNMTSQVTRRGRAQWAILRQPTVVPTLCFCGAEDGAVAVEPFRRARAGFSGGYELEVVEGAGHFMHREKPDLVADRILRFLRAESPDTGGNAGAASV